VAAPFKLGGGADCSAFGARGRGRGGPLVGLGRVETPCEGRVLSGGWLAGATEAGGAADAGAADGAGAGGAADAGAGGAADGAGAGGVTNPASPDGVA